MDLLQWNVSGFRTQLPDLQALIQYCNLSITCLQETHLCRSHALTLRGYAAYCYDHPHGEMASGGAAIIVNHCIYCIPVNLHSPLQVIAVHVHLLNLCFTLCNIYLPPAIPVSPADLTSVISQLLPPFILLGDFNAKNALWGAFLID
jgi:exonuclease III